MSVEIENNIFTIEDEEIDDIEYLEILSLDEIIKDNPFLLHYHAMIYMRTYMKCFKIENVRNPLRNYFMIY